MICDEKTFLVLGNIETSLSSKEDEFYKVFMKKTFAYLGRPRMFIEIQEYKKAYKDLLNALEIADTSKEKDEINKLINDKTKIKLEKRPKNHLIIQKSQNTLVQIKKIKIQTIQLVITPLEVIKELDNMTGLKNIKEEINRIITLQNCKLKEKIC